MEEPVGAASQSTTNYQGSDETSQSARSFDPAIGDGENRTALDKSVVADVSVSLEVTLGYRQIKISDLLELKSGAIVELDSNLSHLAELKLNGRIIARGEIVAVKDNFALKIVEIAD
jgi:flagellar motor switch protein FliN/FliY